MSRKMNRDGIPCDQCPAGKYVQMKCNATHQTKCDDCKKGTYTALPNHLEKCLVCRVCYPDQKKQTAVDCTSNSNTVCECMTGFYCEGKDCDHCTRLTECPPGEGVKVKATRTNDTVCTVCKIGTFSNVTDFSSPCIPHTRCEDYGREVKTLGTTKTDAVCGDFKYRCSWTLPAGLWSGLVLTILIVAVFMFWRARRKTRKADKSKVPVTLVESTPMPAIMPPHQSCPCQESCPLESCKTNLFNPDKPIDDYSLKDSLDSSVLITPVKVSVSFSDQNPINGIGKYSKGSFLRLPSEPQEDEWCGANDVV